MSHMVWMRMPDQSWLGAGASFLGMWMVMMAAMMLPSLTPMLLRYRRGGVELSAPTHLALLTAAVGLGYFAVWALVGALVFPLGAALMSLEMREPGVARAVPLAVGVVVTIAGALQFTAWKARCLACCRGDASCCELPALPIFQNAGSAWRHGIRLGLQCTGCCAGLTAVLLVVGVMDLRAMVLVTAAITVERLVPGGETAASAVRKAIGMALVAAGVLQMAGVLRLG